MERWLLAEAQRPPFIEALEAARTAASRKVTSEACGKEWKRCAAPFTSS